MSTSIGQIFRQITYPKAIGLAILFGGFYFYNIYDSGAKIQTQINEVKQNAQSEEIKKKETDRVKADEKAIKSQVGTLAEKFKEVTLKFPVNLRSDEIISNINTLAKSANIRVVSIKKENLIEEELYDEVPVSVEFSGTFSNLLLFLFNIASLEQVTNIGDLDFSISTSEYDGNIKLLTKIIGYKYKSNSEKSINSEKPVEADANIEHSEVDGSGK